MSPTATFPTSRIFFYIILHAVVIFRVCVIRAESYPVDLWLMVSNFLSHLHRYLRILKLLEPLLVSKCYLASSTVTQLKVISSYS